ncbi:glycosyltransferase family 2 protein [Clostridium thermarum]|uniref:glycosyltransferase family 2 protein n=1 Tax=Clostridium thermarum TaxID=1716543 RepID=UPI001123F243|nr:glycosyltransferase family 2 protein [Clostridium thermarum]
MPENRRTSIVIVTNNNLQDTNICLESIRDYTPLGEYEVIVVDNNSRDGTREWLNQQWDIKNLLIDEKMNYSKCCNLGIGLADKENDILLLRSDVKVTPRWLGNLKKCLNSDETIGAVSSITNDGSSNSEIAASYSDLDEMISFAYENNISNPLRWEQRLYLSGFSTLIKREVINKVGLLDEGFTLANFSNRDFSMRIFNEGYKIMHCHDSFVHNFGNETLNEYYVDSKDDLKVNLQSFEEKWGIKPDLLSLIDTDMVKEVKERSNQKMNILQLDCKLGATLLKLKYTYPEANLYGLEENENEARIGERFFSISTEDFESNYTLGFKEAMEDFFDYIILGEKLQKSINPWKMLRSLKRYVKPGGYIIAKVTNAMYYQTLKDLLRGSYVYSQKTIFNRSFKRTFTIKDIESISAECGFLKPYITYKVEKLSREDESFIEDICKLVGSGSKDRFVPREFIVKLQNESNCNNLSHEEILVEVKYALRRVEHNIDMFSSLGLIKELYEREKISMDDINRIIASDVINKDEVEAILSSYLR